jgi:hypothetical protein
MTLQNIIKGIQPCPEDGICNILPLELARSGLLDRGEGWVNAAVSSCLKYGFAHYSGDFCYPIAGGDFETGNLWDENTEYGNRHAALLHIKANADKFSVQNNDLEYKS